MRHCVWIMLLALLPLSAEAKLGPGVIEDKVMLRILACNDAASAQTVSRLILSEKIDEAKTQFIVLNEALKCGVVSTLPVVRSDFFAAARHKAAGRGYLKFEMIVGPTVYVLFPIKEQRWIFE